MAASDFDTDGDGDGGALNLGCGLDPWGDLRADFALTPAANLIVNIEAGHLPFRDSSFREVRLRCVLEHSRNPGRLLEEIHRILRGGGRLDLLTDNAAYWRFYLFDELHMGGYHGSSPDDRHYAVFTTEHLRDHLKAAGFSIHVLRLEYWEPKVSRKKLLDRAVAAIPQIRHFAYPRIRAVAVKEKVQPPPV